MSDPRFFILLTLLVACGTNDQEMHTSYGVADFVDPIIGTAGHGHVYPGATVPFGSVQLSPDNGTQGWAWCSGYNYDDSTIVGFSHTHLSGTGIGDLCDLLLMPTDSRIDLSKPVNDIRKEAFASTFKHNNEVAQAGYYQVLLDNGINVHLTTTERVGFHLYDYPVGIDPAIVLDLGYHINWDRPVATELHQHSSAVFTGKRFSTGWARDQRIYFALEFSSSPQVIETYDSTQIQETGSSFSGQKLRAKFSFSSGTKRVQAKMGISSASAEGALKALEEIPDWDFARIRYEAGTRWNEELSKIRVTTDDEALLRTFYTALYRTYLAPVIYSDALGQYKAANATIAYATGYKRYDIFSLWDTFRAASPLLTITQPEKINDMVKSLLAHHDEYGFLPVWSLLGNETNTMTGYHAIPVITDAILKGHRDFEIPKAYEAMKRSAMQSIRSTDHYRKYGYIPHELSGQSVTSTLEYAFDDWCIAQIAVLAGQNDDFDYFMKRAQSYRNVFDQSTGFMRARMIDRSWKEPFDALVSDHDFAVAEYTEGNAWQHSWFVPHDIKGLISLHGGDQAFVDKLDTMFSMTSEIRGENVSADISGLIGQYAHGNEPSHHIPYLYAYAGAPWKTQEIARTIMKTLYDDTPEGLCGNEDCGQMSAWLVLSAMGFYPVNPAEGVYVIGAPLFQRVEIDVGNGKSFTIQARYLTDENIYIQAATLKEEPHTRCYLRHFEIMEGGDLILEMGPQPNYLHWTDPEARPPSVSDKTAE